MLFCCCDVFLFGTKSFFYGYFCKLTHYDPRCVGSCVIVSSIILALVFEDRILDYEDVIGIAKQYDERIIPFIDLAYHEGLDSLCLDDEKSIRYTLRTLGGYPMGLLVCNLLY